MLLRWEKNDLMKLIMFYRKSVFDEFHNLQG
jgi:hypothetical protein